MEIERIECDVLVIGAGAAGLRAAIAAYENGCRVLIISKRPQGRAGATPSAVLSYCAAVGQDDSPGLHENDTLRWGYYQGDSELVKVFAERAPQTVNWLEKRGMRWEKENESFSLVRLAGHSRARGLYYDNMTGKEIIRVLNKIVNEAQIEVIPYLWAMDLLSRDNRVAGALAYDWQEGRILALRAGAVVLASGGGQQIFSLNTVPQDLCGDGFALAYRSGARLVDMENVQMYPTVVISPQAARGVPLTSGLLLQEGAELVNANGEGFLHKYTESSLGDATRDVLSYAIAREVKEGRGTVHGGVYLDRGKAAASLMDTKHFRYLNKIGVDLRKTKVEVAPGAHYWLGGVAISNTGATNVDGLYAAGEVAGGLHGANRLAGNALSETIVFGEIAGSNAAAYAKQKGVLADIEETGPCFEQLMRTRSTGTKGSHCFFKDLQHIVQESCGVLRKGSSIRQALRSLNELKLEMYEEHALTYPPGKCNNEFAMSIELFHALKTAQLLMVSALGRQESRGSHHRLDYPQQDCRGPASQIIEESAGKPAVHFIKRSGPQEGVLIHFRNEGASDDYLLYGVKGKTVMEVIQMLPEPAGAVLNYSDHNCKRGLCGHCKMRINGKIELACMRVIWENEIYVERVI